MATIRDHTNNEFPHTEVTLTENEGYFILDIDTKNTPIKIYINDGKVFSAEDLESQTTYEYGE